MDKNDVAKLLKHLETLAESAKATRSEFHQIHRVLTEILEELRHQSAS
jgi:hypothetical protein